MLRETCFKAVNVLLWVRGGIVFSSSMFLLISPLCFWL